MSSIRYEIWVQALDRDNDFDGRMVALASSGTIPLSTTRSAPVPLPRIGRNQSLALVLKVVGSHRAYVEQRPAGQVSTQTGAHVATDRVPRHLVVPEDGAIIIPAETEGTFTVVQAAIVA